MSIEEAYGKALTDTQAAIGYVPTDGEEGHRRACENAAALLRALALAAVEETRQACWKDFGTGVMTTEDRAEQLRLIRRIERLGQ